VRGIEHGNLIDLETAKMMAEMDVFLTPTLMPSADRKFISLDMTCVMSVGVKKTSISAIIFAVSRSILR
jgi:hypothetical protein